MTCSQSSEEPVAATSQRRRAGQAVAVYNSSSEDEGDTLPNAGNPQQKEKLKPARLQPSVRAAAAAAAKPAKKRKICSKQHGQLLLPQAMRKAPAASGMQLLPPAAGQAAADSAAPAHQLVQHAERAPEQPEPEARGSAEPAAEQPARSNGPEQEASPVTANAEHARELGPPAKSCKAAVLKWPAPGSKSTAAADKPGKDQGTEWSAQGTRRSSRLAQQPSKPQYEDDEADMTAEGSDP